MSFDSVGVLALVAVAAEWAALGWLSGVGWPPGKTVSAARWSLRLLTGALLVSFTQLLLALIGIGFGSIPLVLGGAALLAAAMRLAVASVATPASIDPGGAMERRELLGWLLLALVLAAATARALLVPEAGWDAYSHWGLKAQAFTLHGTIVDTRSTHEYYPPLVPLLEAWLMLHRGGPSIDAAKFIWPVVGAAFTLCLAQHFRLALSNKWLAAYAATLVLLGSTLLLESLWTGQADLALTCYLTLSTLAAFQWIRTRERGWLVQLAIFGAAASLAKYEGAPRVAVLVAALVIEAALTPRRALAFALLGALLAGAAGVAMLPWLVYRSTHGFDATSEHVGQLQLHALGGVILAVGAALGGIRTGGGVLAAALLWLAAGRHILAPPLRLLTLVTVGQLVATFAAFLITGTSPEVQAQTSATRLFQHFMPLALFVGAVAGERFVFTERTSVVEAEAASFDAQPIIARGR